MAARGIAAMPVQTLRQLVDRHRTAPTATVRFERRERDGWQTECFAPTWYAFDGQVQARPPAPPRVGSDAAAVLTTLGYEAADVDRLMATGVVGPTEWYQPSRV